MARQLGVRPIAFSAEFGLGTVNRNGIVVRDLQQKNLSTGPARDEVNVRPWFSAECVTPEAALNLTALRDGRSLHYIEARRLALDVDGNEVVMPGSNGYLARPADRPVQPSTEDTPGVPAELVSMLDDECPQDVDDAMAALKGLPDSVLEHVLLNGIRNHPSAIVRKEAQGAVLAEDPYSIGVKVLPKVRDDDRPVAVLEAAALMDGQWTYTILKKLIVAEAWDSVKRVIKSTDYPNKQALAYALWIASKEVSVPPVVVRTAYNVLSLFDLRAKWWMRQLGVW